MSLGSSKLECWGWLKDRFFSALYLGGVEYFWSSVLLHLPQCGEHQRVKGLEDSPPCIYVLLGNEA